MKARTFLFTLLAITMAVPVYSQGTLEEVVVTAQRREQNLQDVPISVTSFTGAMLERTNITEAADYLALTPNVAFTEGFSTGSRGLGIGIRGISNNVTDESTFINAVGVYLDGFSVAAVPTGVINPQLQDIDRIEVLRGPQGTYFGRNSVGGALNLVTTSPSTDYVGGKLIVNGEDFENAGGQYGVTGIINVPVTGKLAFRAVASYEDSSGLVKNVNPGATPDSGHEYFTGRISILYEPTDDTTVSLFAMHSDEDQGTDETVPSGVWDLDSIDSFGLGCDGTAATCGEDAGTSGLISPADANVLNGNPIGFWPHNRNKTSRDGDERNDNTTTILVLNLSHQLTDDLALKNVTGIIGTTNERFFDNDLLGGGNSLAVTGVTQGNAIVRENIQQGTSWSTEFRAELTKDLYDLTIGVLYAEDEIDRQNGVQTAGQGLLNVPCDDMCGGLVFPLLSAGIFFGGAKDVFESESVAVFADGTWHATEKLDLTFGFRYTNDEITNRISNPRQGRGPGANTEEFDDFSPRFVAGYQFTDDFRGYVNISRGYKAGGTSLNHAGGEVIAMPYSEETLWNYEVGFKSEWMDRRVRLNAAAFYTEWTDMQLESFRFLVPGDLGSNVEEAISISDAEAYGFEIEMAALLSDHLSISGAVGYLDTEVTCACVATIKASFPVNLEGLELPRSPDLTGSISAEYRREFGTGEGWARLDFIYRDEQTTDVEGMTFEQTRGRVTPAGSGFAPPVINGFPYIAPSYEIVNLRAGYRLGNIEVVGFVENLFDKEYFTGTQEDFGLSGFRLRPHPRIFGGSVSYSFGGI